MTDPIPWWRACPPCFTFWRASVPMGRDLDPALRDRTGLAFVSCSRIDCFPLLILYTHTCLEVAHAFNVTGPWCIHDTPSLPLESRTGNDCTSSRMSALPRMLLDRISRRIETKREAVRLFDLQRMLWQSRKEPEQFLRRCIPSTYSLIWFKTRLTCIGAECATGQSRIFFHRLMRLQLTSRPTTPWRQPSPIN